MKASPTKIQMTARHRLKKNSISTLMKMTTLMMIQATILMMIPVKTLKRMTLISTTWVT